MHFDVLLSRNARRRIKDDLAAANAGIKLGASGRSIADRDENGMRVF